MSTETRIAIVLGLLGAIVYALVISDVFWPEQQPSFGGKYFDVFNHYYLAIMDGRMDVPMRILRIEGHFTPDGTGYIYHGVGPLVTRFAAGWAIPLDQVPLIGPTIWLWAVLGTAIYHRLVHQSFMTFGAAHVSHPHRWVIGIALAVWFASPGMLMVSTRALTHETAALAYMLSAGFVYCLAQAALFGRSVRNILVPLAIFAALCVHARPNVAAGLYCGVVLCGLIALWQDRLRGFLTGAVAAGLMGLSGFAYLGINTLKFGDMTTVHGSYLPGPVQYGSTFWGTEAIDSPRASAFIEHGRFNRDRILPNLTLYVFDPPGTELQVAMHDWFEQATAHLGRIRVEWAPGIAFLWMPWILGAVIILVGLRRAAAAPPDLLPALALLMSAFVVAGLIASYGTHTLRYRVEFWPLVISVVLLASPGFSIVRALGPLWTKIIGTGLVLSVLAGVIITADAAWTNRQTYFPDIEWSEDYCRELVAQKVFAAEPADNLCRV